MIRMILCFLFAASIGWSDTINSTVKNPSMAVNGTQRDSSQIINQTCPYWAGDLNVAPGDAGTTNCLNGAGLGNAPSGDWYFVDTKYHAFGTHWATQTAVGMTISGAANTYVRNRYNWSWSAWEKIGGSSDTAYLAADGYTKLPSGLIIQWGVVPAGTNSKNFAIAFPNNIFSITLASYWSNSDNTKNLTATSKTGFSLAASYNMTVHYMAIGY